MTSPHFAWLPDHHVGVVATLAHADDLIAQAAGLLFDYQTQPGGIIVLDEVPMVTFSQTVVVGTAPIPRKVPLLVADALVTLRNALEHTLFAEIEHRDGKLEDRSAQRVEMPAARTYDDFQQWVKGRGRSAPASLQRGSELLRRIDGLQPFHRAKDPQDHPMALLAAHTNHSKHRAPAITAVRLAAMHREDQPLRSLREVESRPEAPLQVGEVIAETPRGTQVPVALFPAIGINRPGTDRWPVLIKELGYLANWVRTQAIPRLITGSEPPQQPLPARYEISIGHDDDRLALLTGTQKTAAQHHSERLQAASVRVDMAETLSQMEDAPGTEQIDAWLESLPDDEVLARMSQLKLTFNYEPDIVLSNLAVLESMRDDAVRFGSADAPLDAP